MTPRARPGSRAAVGRARVGVLAALLAAAAPASGAGPGPASAPSPAGERRSTEEAFAASQRGPFDRIVGAAATAWRLDPFLLKGLLTVESRLRPRAVNRRTGAVGIAQLTAGGRAAVRALRRRRQASGPDHGFTRAQALDPAAAIPAAAELLAHLIALFRRDGGITAYNTGPRGGRLVRRHGYWRVRDHVGPFLLLVLREADRLRAQAGLPPLPRPGGRDRPPRRPRVGDS